MFQHFSSIFLIFIAVIINMNAQSSYLLLPSISDYTDLLEPYQNRIQTAIDAFFDETQIEVNVISAYRFAQDEPFKIKDIWKESANFSLLITVNLHEDLQPLDWEWGTNIALTNSVDAEEELPFSLLEYAKTEVMLPILQGLPDAEGRIFRSPEKYAEAIIQVLEFIKEKKKTNYFVINGNKYYDGVVAHLAQKDEETVVIQAFKHNGQSFPGDAVWEGVPNQVTGGEASLSINEPSSSARGQFVKVSYLQGNKLINLAIRVVIIKVTFEAFPDQVFGFDENPKYPFDGFKYFCYPSYETSPIEGLPWKALKTGIADEVMVKIEPSGIEDKVYFLSEDATDISLSPFQASSSTQTLSITATGTVNSGTIRAQIGGPVQNEAVFCKIKTYAPLMKRLLIVHVGTPNTSFSMNEVTSVVTRIYKESITYFEAFELYPFTLDGTTYQENGKLKVPEGDQYSAEMISIYQNCAGCITKVEDDYQVIFIINIPTNNSDILGRMLNDKYGFVFPSNHDSQSVGETVAHEFGHGAFELRHPWAEFDRLTNPEVSLPCGSSHPVENLDMFNIMGYGDGQKKILRKYQWDKIH